MIQDRAGRPFWRWLADQVFAQVLGEEALAPVTARLTYRTTVKARFPPGPHTIIGIIPSDEWPLSASIAITIK